MADKAKERPVLIIHDSSNNSNQNVSMDRDELTLGRGEECDVVLAERQVSRQHLKVYKEGSRYYAEDLDSKNGTWVNGQQLKGVRELSDGDEIQLALAVRIKFVGSESTMPLGFEPPEIIGGRLRLDSEARRVFIDDTEVDPPLSLPQYRLLELLYNNLGRICTRDSVVEAVWPEAMGEGVSEQAIDALVRRLRDRLGEIDPEHEYIMTIRGHGFRLNNVQ
jgi:DNA-binding winged helix-turn-helix (wHTH) protein